MMVAPVIETERLILRGIKPEDADLYQAFYADADGSAFYGGPLLAHQAWRVMAGDLGHWHLKGFGKWIVVPRETGAPIGGCGFAQPDGWPSHELTWWLMPQARGKGYATEASHAAIAYAYGTLGWPVVETHMLDENAPARAIAARLGGVVDRREVFPDGAARDIWRLPNVAEREPV